MRKVLKTDLEGPASITINASNKPNLHFIQRPFPQSQSWRPSWAETEAVTPNRVDLRTQPYLRVLARVKLKSETQTRFGVRPHWTDTKGIQENWNCCQLSCHHMESKYKNTNQRKEKTKNREREMHPRAILWCSSCNQSGFCNHKTHYFFPLLKTN